VRSTHTVSLQDSLSEVVRLIIESEVYRLYDEKESRLKNDDSELL